MLPFTPKLQLRTLYELNGRGRILSTREPGPSRGPAFALVRSAESCAWAVHIDMPEESALAFDRLAREERPSSDLQQAPMHADRYASLAGGEVEFGPSFAFPEAVNQVDGVVAIDDVRMLRKNFRGWVAEEIPGRSPMVAVMEEGEAVSVCFCARRSEMAAEAGVETAEVFRGRGYASLVTTAWALAVRRSGRLPIYSTSWSNHASLAVARKLQLVKSGSCWSVSGSA